MFKMDRPTIFTVSTGNFKRMDPKEFDEVIVVTRRKPNNFIIHDNISWDSNMAPTTNLLTKLQRREITWQKYRSEFDAEKTANKAYQDKIYRIADDIFTNKKRILIVCNSSNYLSCNRLLCARDIKCMNTAIIVKEISFIGGEMV